MLAAVLAAGFLAGPALAEVDIKSRIVPYDEFHRFAAEFDAKSRTVDLARFMELRAKPGTVVADVRSRTEYDLERIQGAAFLGPDITEENLAAVAPSKDTVILIYCTNSLHPTRMISLTDVTLPQIAYLGWTNVYKLDAIWMTGGDKKPGDVLPMERSDSRPQPLK